MLCRKKTLGKFQGFGKVCLKEGQNWSGNVHEKGYFETTPNIAPPSSGVCESKLVFHEF